MSFPMSFHQGLLQAIGPHPPDDVPDLSCEDSTQQYSMDDPLLSCKQLKLTSPAPLLWGCS